MVDPLDDQAEFPAISSSSLLPTISHVLTYVEVQIAAHNLPSFHS